MGKNLYKYVNPEHAVDVLGCVDHVTLKCSYPKDFNDPYELFLAIDPKIEPNHLAFYAEVIGEIPQRPTTCFSLSPTVTPMWAHYADSLQGFVIEFNEELLAQHFYQSEFGDVEYRDTPNENVSELLYHASIIGKPRYTYFLRSAVFNAAYFTKATCWNYEFERRMVVQDAAIRRVGNLLLIDVPKSCISALICGPRASPKTIETVRNKARELGCEYYEIKIGKGSAEPFFVDENNKTYVFNGAAISKADNVCSLCNEPLATELELCALCRMDDSHKLQAAQRNVYRILADRGLLADYIDGMDEIGRKDFKS